MKIVNEDKREYRKTPPKTKYGFLSKSVAEKAKGKGKGKGKRGMYNKWDESLCTQLPTNTLCLSPPPPQTAAVAASTHSFPSI